MTLGLSILYLCIGLSVGLAILKDDQGTARLALLGILLWPVLVLAVIIGLIQMMIEG